MTHVINFKKNVILIKEMETINGGGWFLLVKESGKRREKY
jgi:hypothetical protein